MRPFRGLPSESRRQFLSWAAGTSLIGTLGCAAGPRRESDHVPASPGAARNLFDLELAAERALSEDAFAYLAGGADDARTVRANGAAFAELGLRPRRLVDVRRVDTSLELFGETLASPILLAPVGFLAFFHPGADLAVARAAASTGHRMLTSSAATHAVGEVAAAGGPVWFQLYPTTDRDVTRGLLERAEAAGCGVVALTVDTPVIGNRERHNTTLSRLLAGGQLRRGNYEGLPPYETISDPGLTWEFCDWLRARTSMRLVLKGIVTAEDTRLALEHGVDGVIVSNHGGRQLESDRATVECLPEVVDAAGGRIPVLMDGGVRRGTDVLKALALGARAVCIGRPYCWGLGAFGEAGVRAALELLQAELVRDMQLAGAPSLRRVTPGLVTRVRDRADARAVGRRP